MRECLDGRRVPAGLPPPSAAQVPTSVAVAQSSPSWRNAKRGSAGIQINVICDTRSKGAMIAVLYHYIFMIFFIVNVKYYPYIVAKIPNV